MIIKDVIAEVGAGDPKDMGRVMKSIMPRVKGQIDGRLLSELVKKGTVGNDSYRRDRCY